MASEGSELEYESEVDDSSYATPPMADVCDSCLAASVPLPESPLVPLDVEDVVDVPVENVVALLVLPPQIIPAFGLVRRQHASRGGKTPYRRPLATLQCRSRPSSKDP